MTRFLVAFHFVFVIVWGFPKGPPNPVCFRLTADTLLFVTPALRSGIGYSSGTGYSLLHYFPADLKQKTTSLDSM